MECINIGPLYIMGGCEGHRFRVSSGKGQKKKQGNTMVEFGVAMMSICTHNGSIFHYKVYTDVC